MNSHGGGDDRAATFQKLLSREWPSRLLGTRNGCVSLIWYAKNVVALGLKAHETTTLMTENHKYTHSIPHIGNVLELS